MQQEFTNCPYLHTMTDLQTFVHVKGLLQNPLQTSQEPSNAHCLHP